MSWEFLHTYTYLIRWLHPDDPLRQGRHELPPAARNHCQACAEAKDSESKPYHTWKNVNHVRLKTGINVWCPLSVLYKFDMIWDFCPDMMHIIKTFFERLVIGVFSGQRRPTFSLTEPKKPLRHASDQERREYQAAKQLYKDRVEEYAEECRASDECEFSMLHQKLVDERVQNLVGYPNWIRSSLVQSHTFFLTQNPRIFIALTYILGSFLKTSMIVRIFTQHKIILRIS
jgi:hypothetical protein